MWIYPKTESRGRVERGELRESGKSRRSSLKKKKRERKREGRTRALNPYDINFIIKESQALKD